MGPECLRGAAPPRTHGRNVPRLSREDRDRADRIDAQAEVLAEAYRGTEDALRNADLDPDRFAEQGESWIRVADGAASIVGIYARESGRLIRQDLLAGDEPSQQALSRLAEAEQVLLHVPELCGTAYGVLDGAPVDAQNRELFAVRLVDRSRELAVGVHYRYQSGDHGSGWTVEPVGHSCRSKRIEHEWLAEQLERSQGITIRPGQGRFGASISMPMNDLPSVVHMMQLHLYPDLPYQINYWLSDRFVQIERGERRVPRRYYPATNPCRIADE